MKVELFASGRTELAGNHTDHQNGRALASSIDKGITAVCEPNGKKLIRIFSEGFAPFELKAVPSAVLTREFGMPSALVRGVVSGFDELGLEIGGFDAHIVSTLPAGSGMSSSAAFSVLIGRILNRLFNDDAAEPLVLARIAMNAENRYFGKPCGMMGQVTCAVGGTVYADFKTGEIQSLEADFASMGLTLCLTETGGSHAGLSTSYARIPSDMIYIANLFDKGVLGDVDPASFRGRGWDTSNRPVRRAQHFFDENDRVPLMRDALKNGDAESYMRLMNESGRSSEKYLNNIITSATGDTKLAEGLERSKKLLEGIGAWRVHGGGFAGTVQALMPYDYFPKYKSAMEQEFGKGSCCELHLT